MNSNISSSKGKYIEKASREISQLSPAMSIALHLFPGIVIVAGIFLFSQPAIFTRFGVAEQLGPLFGYVTSLALFLVLLQVGLLLVFGGRHYGKLAIRPVIRYTQQSKLIAYLVFIPLLIAYNAILFIVVAPLIQPIIVNAMFSWYPEKYNFQNFMQAVMQDPAIYAQKQGILVLVVTYIILSGIIGPFVEELYFRGFLLPRMEGFAKKWAPLLNTVLFSFYHLFSPWENLIRVVGLYPVIYLVWRKKNIRFSIITHVVLNLGGGIAFLIVLLR